MSSREEILTLALRTMVGMSQGVLGAASFGDHGNIKNRGYVCLPLSSAELAGLRAAATMAEEILTNIDEE